eukprot:11755311-Karenia_brevis.AAC.1
MRGCLFTDGSVIGTKLGIPRAGWAVVQVDRFGECEAAAYGAVPVDICPTQTIADAEDFAVAMLPVIAMGPLELYIDRQQTVDAARRPAAEMTGPKH